MGRREEQMAKTKAAFLGSPSIERVSKTESSTRVPTSRHYPLHLNMYVPLWAFPCRHREQTCYHLLSPALSINHPLLPTVPNKSVKLSKFHFMYLFFFFLFFGIYAETGFCGGGGRGHDAVRPGQRRRREITTEEVLKHTILQQTREVRKRKQNAPPKHAASRR